MKQTLAIQALDRFARQNRVVFTVGDLTKVFRETGQALQATLARLVRAKILTRAARGVYVYGLDITPKPNLLEQVAVALRRGHYNYVSLESALSEYGAISQVPVDRLTVMTTGRSGEYRTPWGVIEFTHTKRGIEQLLRNTKDVGRGLRLAQAETAWRDLKRVGRNTHLVDMEEFEE